MRFVKISQTEVSSILRLYEGVMSYACHGLFYREGEALGDQLAELCKGSNSILDGARKILIARGWVEDIVFDEGEIRVKGSIEAYKENEAVSCHRLRGILSRLRSIRGDKNARLVEVECASSGSPECIFKPEVS
jgi:predicted hydrocarbon binding protein